MVSIVLTKDRCPFAFYGSPILLPFPTDTWGYFCSQVCHPPQFEQINGDLLSGSNHLSTKTRCGYKAASFHHYIILQESGRAGRDGLPSECVLFFRSGDVPRQVSISFTVTCFFVLKTFLKFH